MMPSPPVLVAEDSAVSQVVAQAMLRREGLGSVVARDGAEAVEMALATDYAAILMDCQMPGLDGYEAARQIRRSERPGRVAIIAMSAHSLPGERGLCLAAGMDDYIGKPLASEQLREVMARWLPPAAGAVAGARQALAVAGDQSLGMGGETPVLDTATILRLRDEYPPDMRHRLIGAFERALPAAVREILSAAQHGRWADQEFAARRLRRTSLMLGAARLGAACETMESSAGRQGTPLDRDSAACFQAIAQEASVALRRQFV